MKVTVKPQRQNAWSLSYDEDANTTKLAYIVDIYSENGKEPQTVRVDVYDPELNKVGEVTNQTIEHTVADDGKTFTYYFNGPVEMKTAGDYHFVVVAQAAKDDPSAEKEDKDAGKWALEQNSAAQTPTYTIFAGYEPPVTLAGAAFGGTSNGSPSSSHFSDYGQTAGEHLERAGYKAKPPASKWWKQRYSGAQNSDSLTFEEMIGHPLSSFVGTNSQQWSSLVKEQTMPYTAIWASFGHGFNGDIMAHWAAEDNGDLQVAGEVEDGFYDSRWSFLVPDAATKAKYVAKGLASNRIFILRDLPSSYAKVGGKYFKKSQLAHVRIAAFLSCESANATGNDLPGTAVSMGAKSAIGVDNLVVPTALGKFSQDFFYWASRGYYVYKAAERANHSRVSLGVFNRDVGYRVKGNSNTVITDSSLLQARWVWHQNPHWGDDKGPDAR